MVETMGEMKRTNFCGDLREDHIGEKVTIMGWVSKSRDLGALIFTDVRDYKGIVQVVFDVTEDADLFEKAKTLRSEFVIAVEGTVRERSSINEEIPTGHIEILADQLKILSKSDIPPIYIKDDDNVSEDMRLKYRTLDLRKPFMQRNMRTRAKIAKLTRDFFDSENFIEIETPMLNKPTPEGARDYLVPSRVHPGHFYALPQSPQLMKQLLMVSGFDRYIQITKCFRDEDLRANRQPEFTQIDMELSFVDVDEIIDINERYLKFLFKELIDYDLKLPLPRMTFDEAMDRFGVDKPDLRFGMEIINFSEEVKSSGFKVFGQTVKDGGKVKGLKIDSGAESFSRRKIDALEDFVKDYGAKGLAWIKLNEDGIQSPIAKFLEEDVMEAIIAKAEAVTGDLLVFVADKDSVCSHSLGNLRVHLGRELDLIDEDAYELLWIVDFPLLEFDEDENRYVAKHHPFTSPKAEDLELLETSPEKCKANAYDIVINGEEVGGGSIRINDPEVQAKMFKALGLSDEEVEEKFSFLIEAFKFGAPPHGGLAYGLDRLVMLFTGEENIRNVIAFPKTQSATDLLTGAPGYLDNEHLSEVHIEVVGDDKNGSNR